MRKTLLKATHVKETTMSQFNTTCLLPAPSTDKWREAVRETWRRNLLYIWERPTLPALSGRATAAKNTKPLPRAKHADDNLIPSEV